MSTTSTSTLPTVLVGTKVRFDSPMSGWGHGTVIDARPQRVILGHDGRSVVWGDSTTHVDAVIQWTDGHADFGTEPGMTSHVSVGHSFAGTSLDSTDGGWPVGFKTEAPS